MNRSGRIPHAGTWNNPYNKNGHSISSSFKVSQFGWLKALVVAATLILILGVLAIISGRNKQKPIDWVNINAQSAKQNISLPDGSTVILRKGSSISYPADYGILHRIVQLKGEAYFDIIYNSSIPFRVRAINEIITEAGTSFLIRSTDSVEKVFVTEGRVTLENSSKKGEYIVVNAGQQAEFRDKEFYVSETKDEHPFAWKNERLVFNHASLKKVAADIYNFYGVPVNIDTAINADDIWVTAQFDNHSLPGILEEIGERTGLMIRMQDHSVFITNIGENASTTDYTTAGNNKPPKKKRKSWWMFWVKR